MALASFSNSDLMDMDGCGVVSVFLVYNGVGWWGGP